MKELTVENFKHGVITAIEDRSIPRGAYRSALNFITKGDKVELRGGSLLLGDEITGSGRITGLGVSPRVGGEQILWRSRGRKIEYYTPATDTWSEVGTNLLPSAADGDEVSFAPYQTLAGYQMFLSSPNSGFYKIMVANPGSYTDLTDTTKNYKGRLRIQENRSYLWGRLADKTAPYLSHIDEQNFTTVSNEDIGNGDGTTTVFTGTLAFKAAGTTRTCFAISAQNTAGTEVFTDNHDGTLTSNLGGTGTINYTTGAISLTFNTAPAGGQDILVTYQWENSNNGGLGDFTFSGTRVAGEGDVFRQDDGGFLQNILPYKDINYCLHQYKTWQLQLTIDDTNAVNIIYRDRVGIPNWRAAVATGEGIYHINDVDEDNPYFAVLRYGTGGSTEVEPIRISDNIKLTDYAFDQADCIRYGDLVIFLCRTTDSSVNNRMFIYNRKYRNFDVCEAFFSTMIIWDGKLVCGSSISNNVYQFFSGYDDDDSLIIGHIEFNKDDLDLPLLKKCKRIELAGQIQINQKYRLYISTDNSPFVEQKNSGENYAIEGTGSYVDKSNAVTVGSPTLGRPEVGGGSDGINAYPYRHEIKLGLDKFEDIIIRIVPEGLGYMSITKFKYKDIRVKRQRLPVQYR